MRIKLILEKENLSLPLSYKNIIQSVIYNMLPKETIGKFYHNQGFRDKEKVFKLFVFSDLFGKYQIKNQKIIFEKNIILYISAIDEEFLKCIYQFLTNNDYIFICKQQVNIKEIVTLQLTPFSGEKEVVIETLSPVTAYINKDNYFTYYKPSDKEFIQLIKNNIVHKISAYKYPIKNVVIEIEEVLYEKKIMSKFKNTFYESYRTKLKIKTNFETLNLIYNTGLSNKGSCGFGMINIKDEKNNLFI